jgi:photosystem II stability/assembly factor-like uncharacterized protein
LSKPIFRKTDLDNMDERRYIFTMLRFLLLVPLIIFGSETEDTKSQDIFLQGAKKYEAHYLPVDWVNQIIVTKGTPSCLYAATYFGVYKSEDGLFWQTENDGLESLIINALLITNDRLYAATDDGVFMKKISSSLWKKVSLPDNLIYSLANLGTTVYAGTIDRIWRSRDFGKNWELAKEGVGTILSIVATNCQILAVSYEDGVFVSYDKGGTWKNIGPKDMGARGLIMKENRLYLVGEEGVMMTEDWDNDWRKMNYGLLSKELQTIAMTKDRLYVGSSLGGCFVSKDDGESWGPINTGLDNTNIRHLFIDPDEEKIIYAATEGGIYITETEGRVWRRSPGLLRVEENPPLAITPESVRERMEKLGIKPPAEEGEKEHGKKEH